MVGPLGGEWSSLPVGALVDLHMFVQIFNRMADQASSSPFLSLSTAVLSSYTTQALDSKPGKPAHGWLPVNDVNDLCWPGWAISSAIPDEFL